MRNGADDSMMAAAGVATTVASGLNAAAGELLEGHADALMATNSWFERVLILLLLPVSIFAGFALWRWGFPNYVCVGGGFVALYAWGLMGGAIHRHSERLREVAEDDDCVLDEDEDY